MKGDSADYAAVSVEWTLYSKEWHKREPISHILWIDQD